MINIYCDESCHLPNDGSSIMVIGGISCPEDKTRYINDQIRRIKRLHGIYEFAEIKWIKVSNSKVNMFFDLINLFFDNAFLSFRAVIATDKQKLDLDKFSLTYDDWYQRIYYLVLKEMLTVQEQYNIYVDIKDTKGSEKIELLKKVLNRTLFSFYDDTVKKIQLVHSDEIQLLQLTDLLIGAVSYANRNLTSNQAKMQLIERIIERSGRSIVFSTPRSEQKFNLFKWSPREV